MQGGKTGSYISLRIPVLDDISGDQISAQFGNLFWAYAADITHEVIIGFPFLSQGNLLVDCR